MGTTPEYSIRRTKYYGKYFTMEVQFSKEDLENLLNADNVDKLVKEWGEKRKPMDSFSQIVNDFDKDQLDNKKEKLINGVFAILYYYQDKHGVEIKKVFDVINENGFKSLRTWFDEKLKGDCELPRMSAVLDNFCYYFWGISEDAADAADTAIIKLLIKEIVDVYFQKHADSTVLDLKGGNKELNDITKNIRLGNRDLFIEGMIEHYSQKVNKPTNKEFDAVEIEDESVIRRCCLFDDKKKEDYLQKIRETCCSDKPIKPAKKNRFAFPWKKP